MQLVADHTVKSPLLFHVQKMLDAKAFLPSDIIHSYSGTSIEIIDTDAEGRLVLADGISI
jgi:leucyl aminopeptidase